RCTKVGRLGRFASSIGFSIDVWVVRSGSKRRPSGGRPSTTRSSTVGAGRGRDFSALSRHGSAIGVSIGTGDPGFVVGLTVDMRFLLLRKSIPRGATQQLCERRGQGIVVAHAGRVGSPLGTL